MLEEGGERRRITLFTPNSFSQKQRVTLIFCGTRTCAFLFICLLSRTQDPSVLQAPPPVSIHLSPSCRSSTCSLKFPKKRHVANGDGVCVEGGRFVDECDSIDAVLLHTEQHHNCLCLMDTLRATICSSVFLTVRLLSFCAVCQHILE